ncbi:unnamed protein product [marine sediment metagenome]|uniref:Uncharacterized protein n=1 Tax=marine sediment metagenome TaxID=412755 RepID=X1MAV0_9ZZZZ
MVFDYYTFKVEIKNVKFTSDEGIVFPKTAIISFIADDQEVVSVEKFGHITTEEIYKKIETGKALNLNHCYVKNFSLSIYRDNRNLDKKKYIKLRGFSARHSFFDSKPVQN